MMSVFWELSRDEAEEVIDLLERTADDGRTFSTKSQPRDLADELRTLCGQLDETVHVIE